jgi:uncharacterized GH25 family protein
MTPARILSITLVVTLSLAGLANAHFVWIKSADKEGKLVVRAGFGDPNQWDSELSDNMQKTKYFVRKADGSENAVELPFVTEEEAYTCDLDHSGPAAILGVCEYGTFGFGGGTPSFLKYFAKRLHGAPADWKALSGSEKLPMEAIPELKDGKLTITVLADGKPLPDAAMKLYGPKSKGTPVKTGADGKVTWPLEGAGEYSLYVGRKLEGSGTYEGEKYEGIREYATLTFDVPE